MRPVQPGRGGDSGFASGIETGIQGSSSHDVTRYPEHRNASTRAGLAGNNNAV